MSEYTRYLLKSAGIKATEKDIALIDASGHPAELIQALSGYMPRATDYYQLMCSLCEIKERRANKRN